jgi:PAS domain S-box-containing protein
VEEKPKILIVDDEKGLRIGTHRLLESEGYYVESAENGTEGINLGTKKDFDLAIIDLKMPDIDGLEVLQTIKQEKPNTVCFIATAFASYDTAIEATRIGAFSYIPKPFTPEELLNQIRQGYKQRKLLIEAERLKREREENLLAIADEKSRLNTVIESINDGVLVVNKVGELVYYNNAALKLLDIEDIDLGEFILDRLPQKISNQIKEYLTSEENLKKSTSEQLEIKPNNELFVETVCSPVNHSDGKFAGVVVVVNNITEFKRIELIKNQFVSMVAHELKTPVVAVMGFIDLLLDNKIQLTHEQHDDYMKRSSTRLKGLIDLVNDLLDISRMELKTKHREIEELDIIEILKSTIMFLEISAKERSITFETKFEDNLPLLNADQNEITRLFTNILSNAIKYNKENGKIIVNAASSKNYLVVKIEDTGIGMKPENKNKLFSEFFRIKNKYTRNVSGTGLGLTIVKRIVDSYHGKIEVESEFENGTTFTIYLPIKTK